MKSVILFLVFCFSFKAFGAQFVELNKEEFKTLYYTMMVDTYKAEDHSLFAGMGGVPVPYILIYSMKKEKLISDNDKFSILELDQLNNGKLTAIPLIIKNRPEKHHFFNSLPFKQLKRFVPQVNISSDFIVLHSSATEQAAVSTEELFMRARNGVKSDSHVPLPILLAHINSILEGKKWQEFKYTSDS